MIKKAFRIVLTVPISAPDLNNRGSSTTCTSSLIFSNKIFIKSGIFSHLKRYEIDLTNPIMFSQLSDFSFLKS
jgi:hypothetical protein